MAKAPLTGPTVGDRIREAYVLEGMTRADFARAGKFAYDSVIDWEQNRSKKGMRTDTLDRIAAVVGRDRVEFFPPTTLAKDRRADLLRFAEMRRAAGRPVPEFVLDALQEKIAAYRGQLTDEEIEGWVKLEERMLAPAPVTIPVPEGKRKVPPSRRQSK